MKWTGENWRGSEAREGDQRDMEGLERRGVDWRQRKTGRGEYKDKYKEVRGLEHLDGFERMDELLREIVAERGGVRDKRVGVQT